MLADSILVQVGPLINNILLQQIALCVLVLLTTNLIESVESVRKLFLHCSFTTYVALTSILSLVLLTVKAIHQLVVISKIQMILLSFLI